MRNSYIVANIYESLTIVTLIGGYGSNNIYYMITLKEFKEELSLIRDDSKIITINGEQNFVITIEGNHINIKTL